MCSFVGDKEGMRENVVRGDRIKHGIVIGFGMVERCSILCDELTSTMNNETFGTVEEKSTILTFHDFFKRSYFSLYQMCVRL